MHHLLMSASVQLLFYMMLVASAQVFAPYGRPYTLPIPSNAKPRAVSTAPNVNYPQSSSGGVMSLADATTDFALRLSGEDVDRAI